MRPAVDAASKATVCSPAVASDSQLICAVAAGDEVALGEIARRYRTPIQRLCRRIAGADSDDCAQEALARIWRKAALYNPASGNASGWLMTLTRNAAYNLVRSRRVPTLALEIEPAVEDPSRVDRFWIEHALAQLPAQQRTVLELAYFHDRSQAEIAAELGVPLGTVKSWSRRGLNQLATLMREDGE